MLIVYNEETCLTDLTDEKKDNDRENQICSENCKCNVGDDDVNSEDDNDDGVNSEDDNYSNDDSDNEKEKCLVEKCKKKRMPGFHFCFFHKCGHSSFLRYGVSCGNLRKNESLFCEKHSDLCVICVENKKFDGSLYCVDCKCVISGCLEKIKSNQNSFIEIKLCSKHFEKCCIDGCENSRNILSNYCNAHQCCFSNENNIRCTNRRKGELFCLEHGYCCIKCYKHECMRKNRTIFRYCKFCKCKFPNCNEEIEISGMLSLIKLCPKHFEKCCIDGCENKREEDGYFCLKDSNCPFSGCS